jgi:putative phage-type endonuclease
MVVMMDTQNIEQGSDAWFAERIGAITASRIKDVVAKTAKSGYSASRKNYLAQLLCERMTGTKQESYTNAAMIHGIEQEPFARSTYEMHRDGMVMEVGYVPHPTIAGSGASPDGLVGEDGLLEIKCPNTATHLEYLIAGEVPAEYKPQMAWQMACTGRKWCDFVSYDPRMPTKHQFFCIRYERDDKYIAELEAEVVKFIAELEETIAKLEAL